MALPHLIKFIYTSGTDEVIRRGKKIHAIGFAELTDHDELMGSVTFRVRDDAYSTFYKVQVQKFKDAKLMNLRCTCPYNLGDICRHEAAALFQLQELMDRNMLGLKDIEYDQRHTVIKMKHIDLKTVRVLTSHRSLAVAEQFLRTQTANIYEAKDEKVTAEIEMEGQEYRVAIQKNEERNFDTSCNCMETHHPLCEHKAILFMQLLNAYGPHYFDTIRNWDKEKNKLLRMYGYSLRDDLEGKFEFTYQQGKPFLRVIDPTIKKVDVVLKEQPAPVFADERPEEKKEEEDTLTESNVKTRLGIVFNTNHALFPFFSVDIVKGESDEEGTAYTGTAEKIDLTKFVDTEGLTEEDKQLLQQVRRLQTSEINKYISRNSPFSSIWENIIPGEGDELPEDTRHLIIEYMHQKLGKLFSEYNMNPFIFWLPKGKAFKTANLRSAWLSPEFIQPEFEVRLDNSKFTVQGNIQVNGEMLEFEKNEWNSSLIYFNSDVLYLWNSTEDVMLVDSLFRKGVIKINKSGWQDYLKKELLPLARRYKVDFENSLVKEIKRGDPEVKIFLQEKGEYLVFHPVFNYKGYEVKGADKQKIFVAMDDQVLIVERNVEKENEFTGKLEKLHSQFIHTERGHQLALKGADVLKNNWFFLFVDTMNEWKVPVLGFEVLKNFRFNTAKPKTQIYVSSGMDWFDARVDILFGDQRVSVNDVKKALANKQSFVQLSDGTLGILPEEWLKKYSLLFKVGEGKYNQLRLSKYHLSVIDELYEKRDEEEVMIELEEKYQRLKGFNKISAIPLPEHLLPIMRPYQAAGYHWVNYLQEVGWGGILADDMGLGKTVQALSYLHHFLGEKGKLNALVVCPTTLIYNWENEIKKFTPQLTYHIHHGGQRTRDKKILLQNNVTITTYGTLRSDIRLFTELWFDYVILDESQAIKNPHSKVAKAATLLNANNRLCLTGTPLQNNTFDIYAQMNFLNPGMLGSVEFFRNEFATPIDKFGEKDQKEHLKKLLYPFILRRTKEQVAKDLPEKTETVLYCEMEDDQRKIYDAYRNDYRSKILGTIDEAGIEKSQFTILQGLMKLRQICDSPAILNEQEKYPNHSIKLEELSRELSEDISDHKALIFSQFLGMLALIRQKLEEMRIPYVYFDGSTTATDREKAIQEFQNNTSCRVFLISLKAGGVGLNLTAADYVYIVDPWWNPAVEQQAIDRTHRIGQTKNIFAYRMICKDSIEDKILQLQERKRSLAKDLITDDATFVKSLTREDVEYLFS